MTQKYSLDVLSYSLAIESFLFSFSLLSGKILKVDEKRLNTLHEVHHQSYLIVKKSYILSVADGCELYSAMYPACSSVFQRPP